MKFNRSGRGEASGGDPIFHHVLARANAARDLGDHARAAVLYGEAVELSPARVDLLVQRAHMLKESGDFQSAEFEYLCAYGKIPDDADLCLQLGHYYKVVGRPGDAQTYYRAALRCRPRWSEASDELRRIAEAGWIAGEAAPALADAAVPGDGLTAVQLAKLVPALVPGDPDRLLHEHSEGIEIRRFGTPEYGYWGNQPTFRGVEAIRGFCVSGEPIKGVQVLLNGLAVANGPVRGGYDLKHERDKARVRKYVFNVWVDFASFAPGRYTAEIRCTTVRGRAFSFKEQVVIAALGADSPRRRSEAFVPLSDPDAASLEARVRALPSEANPARRSLFPESPKTILLMRTDQLGDMVSSSASVRRLREIFPEARFVGLMTVANVDIARTLGLFDELIVADFPDDPVERRRVMPLPEQEALRRKLASYQFDVAIDLAQASVSRELLLLSGAPFVYGVGGGDWPWLSAEFGLNTHDPMNRLDMVPHSAKTLALVETLGALARNSFQVMPPEHLSRSRLTALGLAPDDRFVVLHMGARLAFSRWPYYPMLAQEVLRRTGRKVVMITEDPAIRATLPADLAGSDRLLYFDKRLPFDDFDALVSFCDAMVGNDSGPKHLAALRGTHVVTIFAARVNWREWGQEEVGIVMTRRVPCAGCAIFHDAEECGKDFCCITDIKAEEVFAAMKLEA